VFCPGEAVLLDQVSRDVSIVLDLGTGDGRLLRLLKIDRPNIDAVALDISSTMLKAARDHFANDTTVKVVDMILIFHYLNR
jgi:tRNA (cmo5U34)-methyltransferase